MGKFPIYIFLYITHFKSNIKPPPYSCERQRRAAGAYEMIDINDLSTGWIVWDPKDVTDFYQR